MKKLLLIGLLALFPSLAQAQCNGVFAANTLCGNNTGVARTPFQIPATSGITGPGSTTVGDLVTWTNTSGTGLGDLPPAALTSANDTNVTVTLGGTPATALVKATSITMGWTGVLAAARLNTNVVQSIVNDTNVTGSISAQALTLGWTGTLAAGRLNANVVQSFTNDTNVTASISAQNATLGWSGVLAIARGGTGASTQAAAAAAVLPIPVNVGDVVYWNGTIWTTLAGNTSGTQFLSENASGLPAWVTVSGTGTVTSITFNGGVNATVNPCTTSCTVTSDGNYSGWALGNCTLAASVASNLLTVALKDNTGADPSATSPCNINYRNVTPATGSTTLVAQTAALSISTFATGASLGTSNNTAFRFWVVVFNNAGTNVLALINCSNNTTITPLNEGIVASSTAISGAATSIGVFYTPNGTTVTSKAFRILGYIEYNSTGLVTAGTYATAPNFIQVFGPGIRKPGDEIQIVTGSGSATNSSTSSSFGTGAAPANSVTVTITPTSAANIILATFGGNAVTATIANTSAICQLFRGASGAVNNAVGNIGIADTSGSNIYLQAFDTPNTITAIQYTQRVRNADNTTSVSCPSSVGGGTTFLFLREIQG